MIGIEIKGSFLDLGDEAIRLEKINPIFITELFQDDFSFPFTVSDTENNLRILGFSNVLEVLNRTVEIDCHLWLFGVPYIKSKIILSACNQRTLRINLVGGVKAMRIGEKSLKEINFGQDYLLGPNGNTTLILNTVKAISQTTDYRFYGFCFVPYQNSNFYEGANNDFIGIVNKQNSTTGDFLENNAVIGNKYNLVPWLFLFFVLSKIFEEEGLVPSGDFWNDPEMEKLLIYNNFALDKPSNEDNTYVITGSSLAYNTNTRLKLYKGLPTTFDFNGAWSNSLFEYTIQQAGDIIIDVSIDAYSDTRNTNYFGVYEPHFNLYIDNVLDGTLSFPSQSYGNFNRKLSVLYTASIGDIGKKIHLSNVIAPVFLPLTGLIFNVAATSYLLITNSSDPINIYDNRVSFKNHVKDITVSEFLSEFKNIGVSIEFDYNNSSVKLNYEKNYLNSNYIQDWSDKASSNYELNFEDKNKGFKVNYNFGSTDRMVETNFKKYFKANYKGSHPTFKNIAYPSNLGDIRLIENSNQLYITVASISGAGYVWQYFADNYYDIILGKGEKDSKSKIAPMFMTFAENEGGTSLQNKCLIPVINEPGSSNMFGIGINDFDLRFVFLRGENQFNFLSNPEGGKYIYAGTTALGINGNVVGNYEFTLNSKKGLIDLFILDFLKALTSADLIEREIKLNEVDILNLNIKRKIVIDGIYYLIKNVSISVAKNLKISIAKMLKV